MTRASYLVTALFTKWPERYIDQSQSKLLSDWVIDQSSDLTNLLSDLLSDQSEWLTKWPERYMVSYLDDQSSRVTLTKWPEQWLTKWPEQLELHGLSEQSITWWARLLSDQS